MTNQGRLLVIFCVAALVGQPAAALADTQFSTDSPSAYGYSPYVFNSMDVPPLTYPYEDWFMPDRARHDMAFYDYEPSGTMDLIFDRNMRWSSSSIQRFLNDAIAHPASPPAEGSSYNLVHEVRASNRHLYEADSYISTNLPQTNAGSYDHNEDDDELEELREGREEKEVGIFHPEYLSPNVDYYVQTYWQQLGNGQTRFNSESELCYPLGTGSTDYWAPRRYDEIGWVDVTVTSHNPGLRMQWSYNTPGNFEGWFARNIAPGGASVNSGKLFTDPAGADPYIESSNLWADSNYYRYVRINLASNGLDRYGNVYFRTEYENYYSADKRVEFSVQNCSLCGSAGFNVYSLYMDGHPKWAGRITGIRVDAANNGQAGTNADSIAFDYVALVP